MKPDDEIRLEEEIGLALKGLPELKAPPTLMRRVLTKIESRAELPRYRRSWQNWPVGLQTASFIALLLMFGGLTFGAWELFRSPETTTALHRTSDWFSGLSVIWNTLHALAGAALLAIRQLGTGVIVAGIILVMSAYFACIGLGTVAVRFTFARR
jgi:hypothetical protein